MTIKHKNKKIWETNFVPSPKETMVDVHGKRQNNIKKPFFPHKIHNLYKLKESESHLDIIEN
jgi:hypothetical protein